MDKLLQKEQLVERFIRESRPADAIQVLFDLIVECVGRRDFEKAETLRARIFDIDSLALSEIIRSAEIIEEGKKRLINRDRREIWAELFSILTTEESNALYYACEDRTYQAYQSIFDQGKLNPYLYFINSGRLNLIHNREGSEIFIKTLSIGDIAGEDTFFAIALSTASLISISDVTLSLLNRAYLDKWKNDFPVLESKLHEFSHRSTCVTDLLKKRALDRRIYKRIPFSSKAEIQLMKSSGVPIGSAFKVLLADVSMGGMCFLVRINKRETARLLLGQRLNVRFTHGGENFLHEVEKMGLVVAVTFHAFEDYSVHVKFDTPLHKIVIMDMENHPVPASRS